MKMNRFLLVSTALWFASTVATFADNPFLGTWKLDESKSTFASGSHLRIKPSPILKATMT